MKAHILIIEDDDLQYEIYEETLGQYRLTRATKCSDALRNLPGDPPNLLILDHVLAEGELGLDFLPEFKELLPYVPIIVVSGALEVRQQMKLRCKWPAARPFIACPSRWTCTNSERPSPPRSRNAETLKSSGSLKRSNVRAAWTHQNYSAAPPTAVSRQNRIAAHDWEIPRTAQHLRAGAPIRRGPPHHHSRPAGINPPRPA